MQHPGHLRPRRQPARHLQPGLLLVRQPHPHGAQAAQGQPAIVRAGILAQPARAGVQRVPVRGAVHRDAADQDVGVPGRVFGRRLDRDIDAVPERLEVMDPPGVVHHHLDAPGGLPRRAMRMRMRRARDRRDVLHLEGVAARAFGVHDRGVRAQQRGDAGPVDQRIVETRLDAEPLQHALGEIARRAVDAVRHQQVVAGLQERQQRRGHRGEAGADDGAARAALDLGDDVLQRPMRGTAAQPIGQHALAAHPAQPLALGDGGIQHGGAAQQRRVDEAVGRLVRPPGVRQPGVKSKPGMILRHISLFPIPCSPAYRYAHPIRSTIRHTPRPPPTRRGAAPASGCTR